MSCADSSGFKYIAYGIGFENDRRNSEVQHLESEVIKDSYAALKDGHGLAVQRLRAELAVQAGVPLGI